MPLLRGRGVEQAVGRLRAAVDHHAGGGGIADRDGYGAECDARVRLQITGRRTHHMGGSHGGAVQGGDGGVAGASGRTHPYAWGIPTEVTAPWLRLQGNHDKSIVTMIILTQAEGEGPGKACPRQMKHSFPLIVTDLKEDQAVLV